jgi:hypothetical protein
MCEECLPIVTPHPVEENIANLDSVFDRTDRILSIARHDRFDTLEEVGTVVSARDSPRFPGC